MGCGLSLCPESYRLEPATEPLGIHEKTVEIYPVKTCSIGRLIRHTKLVAMAKSGDKTQQRRDGIYAYPGETFILDDVEFTITGVERQRLVDMTEMDAKAEGYPSMEAYQHTILKMHSGMRWDENKFVWVHYFQINSFTD